MKYVQLVNWSAKADGIRLEMLGDDEALHSIEIGTACAAALAGTLAAEAERMGAAEGEQQLVRPTGMQTGKTESGEPVIVFSFKGGTELPMVFKSESLGVLVAELSGLLRAVDKGTQFRWN